MKKLIVVLFITANFALAQETIDHYPDNDLIHGEQYALFGNDVKFREQPNTNSKVLTVLKIGEMVEIIEKSDKTLPYNGIESPFYKVRYKSEIGYILGGLLSLERKESEHMTYVFAYKKDGEKYKLLIRSITKNLEINEITTALGNPRVSIHLSNNKGLSDIDNILYINNEAEACMVEGGGIYFFQTKNDLKKVFQTSTWSDAGVFWQVDKLIFPAEENGVENKIVYEYEQGQYGDEETNEIFITKKTKELRWENGDILPKPNIND